MSDYSDGNKVDENKKVNIFLAIHSFLAKVPKDSREYPVGNHL